jgi:predicted PurR-regulated permease PerM
VLGFFGVLLAVPITSILKILEREFVLPTLREMARQGS